MSASTADAKQIFLEAVENHKPECWPDFLNDACGSDTALRERVEALLAAYRQPNPIFDGNSRLAPLEQPSLIDEGLGTTIGPYKLLEQIGEGGFGVVFLAEQDRPVRRKVALKIIKPGMDTRQVIARFEAERQALAMMDHPNIAKVFDAGTTSVDRSLRERESGSRSEPPTLDPGRPYFVMELVQGVPITEYCDQCNLSTRERLELFITVCQAVQHAHQKGVIHRDIKPSNVLVAMQDGQPTPKIIDFGVAKAIGEQSLTEHTLTAGFAQMIGTPMYMSPEQAELSPLGVDTRSDIYSLGVLLYELLAGTTPFDKERLHSASYDELRRIIREEEPPRPSARLSSLSRSGEPSRTSSDSLPLEGRAGEGVSAAETAALTTTIAERRRTDPRRLIQSVRGDLDWIVMKCLQKDRTRRYATVSELATDIERHLANEPVTASPPSATYRFSKFARRNRQLLTVAGLLFALVSTVAGSLVWIAQDRTARRTQLTAQLGAIVGDAERLMANQDWPRALAAVERAEAALTAGPADEPMRQRVSGLSKDLQFVNRLEQIGIESAATSFNKIGEFTGAPADREFARAFAEYGVDVEQLPVATSIARLKARPAIVVPVAAALDDWIETRRDRSSEQPADWKRLVEIARGIDSDPLRDRMRASWGQDVTPEIQAELRRLAEAIDVAAQHPATLLSLSNTLIRMGEADSAIMLLYRAQSAHPQDLPLNNALGRHLCDITSRYKDSKEAARFFTAAVSLRPDSAPVRFNLGRAFQLQGKLIEAESAYRQAILVRPDFALAHFNLGNLLRAQSRLPEAEVALHDAIRFAPEYGEARVNLGTLYRDQGKLAEAEDLLREAIDVNPDLIEAHSNLAYVLVLQGKLPEAETEYHEVIRLDPEMSEAHFNLGRTFDDQGKLKEAEEEFREAIRINPEYAMAHGNLGDVLKKQGKLDQAETEYLKAISIQPDFACSHSHLALVLIQKGRLDEALAKYRIAVGLQPVHADHHFNFGLALAEKGLFDDAVVQFRKAIELMPKYGEAYAKLGPLLAYQGKNDEALVVFNKAVELAPDLVDVWNDRGVVHFRLGQYDKAVFDFSRSIELNSESPVAWANRGNAHLKLKQFDEAIVNYSKAIQIDPNWIKVYKSLIWLYSNCPDPKFRDARRAVELATKLGELAPKDGEFWFALSVARYRADDFDAAIDAMNEGMKLRSDADSHQWFFLAMAESKRGNQDAAREWYDKAVDWMEKNDPAHEELLRFRAEAVGVLGISQTNQEPTSSQTTDNSSNVDEPKIEATTDD
jgi:serine/threonine-protein kinase